MKLAFCSFLSIPSRASEQGRGREIRELEGAVREEAEAGVETVRLELRKGVGASTTTSGRTKGGAM